MQAILKTVLFLLFMYNFCLSVFAIDEGESATRRLHSIVSVTPSEGRVEAHPLFTQNIHRITSSGSVTDALVIEIDQLEPIHVVPICSKYENFAVTVQDRVLYKCGLRHDGTHPTPILMHLFLENDILKIAQSQDSMCSDRRSKAKLKRKNKSIPRWKPKPERSLSSSIN